MDWSPPLKPAEMAESRLVQALLDGRFPPGSNLPPERELALLIGVTRPTLREALQRLGREGWIEIRHGKPTRVRNYWQEGSLSLLASLDRFPEHLPPGFLVHLVSLWSLIAPAYTQLAFEYDPESVRTHLETYTNIADSPEAFTAANWDMHLTLATAAGNPVFTLMLNSFQGLHGLIGMRYYHSTIVRERTLQRRQVLLTCARNRNSSQAAQVVEKAMAETLEFLQSTHEG